MVSSALYTTPMPPPPSFSKYAVVRDGLRQSWLGIHSWGRMLGRVHEASQRAGESEDSGKPSTANSALLRKQRRSCCKLLRLCL